MMAKFLKCSKASVLNTASDGKSGLHWACHENKPEIVKMIVAKKESDINIKNNYGRNALAYCMEEEKQECAKILLESGKLKFEEMKGVEDLKTNEDGSTDFQFTDKDDKKWHIQMNSNVVVSIEYKGKIRRQGLR